MEISGNRCKDEDFECCLSLVDEVEVAETAMADVSCSLRMAISSWASKIRCLLGRRIGEDNERTNLSVHPWSAASLLPGLLSQSIRAREESSLRGSWYTWPPCL